MSSEFPKTKFFDTLNKKFVTNKDKRNAHKVALVTLSKITESILHKTYPVAEKAWYSTCGATSSATTKKWIVDIDSPYKHLSGIVCETIYNLQKSSGTYQESQDYQILERLETRDGYHIITNPFNLTAFKQAFPAIEVKQDGNTVLYSHTSSISIG